MRIILSYFLSLGLYGTIQPLTTDNWTRQPALYIERYKYNQSMMYSTTQLFSGVNNLINNVITNSDWISGLFFPSFYSVSFFFSNYKIVFIQFYIIIKWISYTVRCAVHTKHTFCLIYYEKLIHTHLFNPIRNTKYKPTTKHVVGVALVFYWRCLIKSRIIVNSSILVPVEKCVFVFVHLYNIVWLTQMFTCITIGIWKRIAYMISGETKTKLWKD